MSCELLALIVYYECHLSTSLAKNGKECLMAKWSVVMAAVVGMCEIYQIQKTLLVCTIEWRDHDDDPEVHMPLFTDMVRAKDTEEQGCEARGLEKKAEEKRSDLASAEMGVGTADSAKREPASSDDRRLLFLAVACVLCPLLLLILLFLLLRYV